MTHMFDDLHSKLVQASRNVKRMAVSRHIKATQALKKQAVELDRAGDEIKDRFTEGGNKAK